MRAKLLARRPSKVNPATGGWWLYQLVGLPGRKKMATGPFDNLAAAKRYLKDRDLDRGPFRPDGTGALVGDSYSIEQQAPKDDRWMIFPAARTNSTRAKQNPQGPSIPGGRLVRAGRGEVVHLFDPKAQLHMCKSGINAGKTGGSGAMPIISDAKNAKFLTCTRCMKLAELNVEAGRKPWESGTPRKRKK